MAALLGGGWWLPDWAAEKGVPLPKIPKTGCTDEEER